MPVVETAGSTTAPGAAAAATAASVASSMGAAAAATTAATALPPEGWEPKIIAFCCHWCTYTGADLAGLNRMNYPANVRVLRIPCSGRMNPQYVIEALNKGCDGVLVCGCHPGDCHYVTGNYFAKRRMMIFRRLMIYEGLEPERFQIRWISGAEAGKFRDTVTQVVEQVRALGPLRRSVSFAEKAASEAAAAAESQAAVEGAAVEGVAVAEGVAAKPAAAAEEVTR